MIVMGVEIMMMKMMMVAPNDRQLLYCLCELACVTLQTKTEQYLHEQYTTTDKT